MKSKKGKPKSFWEKLKHASAPTKLTPFFAGLSAAAALGYFLFTIWQGHENTAFLQSQHRPRLFFSRPPELAEPFSCDTHTGMAHFGKTFFFVKNIGDAAGTDALLASPDQFKFVPDPPIGDPIFDRWPTVNAASCEYGLSAAPNIQMFSVEPVANISQRIEVRQAVLPQAIPQKNDARFQLLSVPCVDYSDQYGKRHGTCTSFRFVPSNGEIGVRCNASPVTGTFEMLPAGHCED